MSGERKILFATSNGTGLGHLNRAMAIARRLPEEYEPVFFTLSEAAPVVARSGFRVEYHPSYRRPASGSDWQWNLRLRRRVERLLAAETPDLVVFDGVHPYRALTHVLSARGAPPSVWCRRPMWRHGSSKAPLQRTGAFDAVLEPGELAAEADAGPTVERRDEAMVVDPIVYLDGDELLDRGRATAELGLDPDRPAALVNLGQGGATDRAVGRVLALLAAEDRLQVAALESSIGSGLDVPDGVVRLAATFPMSRYFRAFDLAVAAAGYNAFHELIAFGVPSLFVPMPRNTDDQAARARWAADEGVALAVDGPGDDALSDRVQQLLDPAVREELRDGCERVFPGNGAPAAAALLAPIAAGDEPERPTRGGGPLRRWLRYSSHPVGPSLPIAGAQTLRDHVYHRERARPLGIVYFLGQPEENFESEVEAAISSLGVPRERVMVITDSLEFGTLRRLGVAFQRLPTASELGLDFDDPEYRSLLARRFDEALDPWRGRWRVIRIGTGNEILREEAEAAGAAPSKAGSPE
ncbi:MAG TPA: glycosyltransferase [Solirubrobacterales bacterium]|nr:glycosyltransferase [Solirubrobacterales bacterium]